MRLFYQVILECLPPFGLSVYLTECICIVLCVPGTSVLASRHLTLPSGAKSEVSHSQGPFERKDKALFKLLKAVDPEGATRHKFAFRGGG